ncbi:MAG: DUF4442 domain-containing protein [Flavobacteriales bacterium]|nr:DUF4442 domain-containing protein [Flavobacteriales bacterium]MBP9080388.1 DUF4442 domain-containing protein [Flavobacteriales bacterium]
MNLALQLNRARRSAFHRWVLNAGLNWSVPFNRPHGFRVVPLPTGGIRVEVPFQRANRNHLRGIHACCLATAAELCSGLELIGHLGPDRYRIIMRALHMDYHWQAKAGAHAEYMLEAARVKALLLAPLEANGVVVHEAVVELRDDLGNHLATGRITWQVKRWDEVRTKR